MRPVQPLRLLLCAVAASACDWDLQRMEQQERCSPMERSDLLPGGWCDQSPPQGTVAANPSPPAPSEAPHNSYRVDRAFLERGKNRFETFCAPCHGILGNGQSAVSADMARRKPPALTDPRFEQEPDAEIYQVISHGYGLMPSYGDRLEPRDRWAVVSYVRVLALSQRAQLNALPESVRAEAEPWLK